ncbi:MAG: class I adenylate-forming enzyme family protein [Actinomycetota bacterium]
MTGLRSFADDFDRLARTGAGRPAVLRADGSVVTYAELHRLVGRMGAWLDQRGVPSGGAIVSLLPSSLDAVVLFLACLRTGRQHVPLPCTATAPEVRAVVAMTGPNLLLVADPVPERLVDELVAAGLRPERLTPGESLRSLPVTPSWSAASTGRLLVTTSGSTGSAKAVVIDGDRLWSSAHAFLDHHGLGGSELRFWNYLPMSYLGGLFNLALIPLASGGSFVVDEPFSGRTFLGFWPKVERLDIDALWFVPTIVRGLISLGERRPVRPPEGVRVAFLGTAPSTRAEKLRFRELFGLELRENFGLSETTFLTTEDPSTRPEREPHGVGRVLPAVELDLRPPREADEPDGPLEVAVRTPFQMLGYLRSDGRLDPALDDDGFFRTGDLGHLVDGELVLTGRVRDVVKKGGHLVLLSEPEDAAMTHPDVVEAIGVPVPHDFYGESYVLVVVGRDDLDPADVETWLRGRLARHKLPTDVLRVDELPRTASGKVRRGELAAHLGGGPVLA